MAGPGHVTFIMAVYNSAETVESAVTSVRAQTFARWDLIVVDDASDDGTAEVLDQYRGDPQITLMRNAQNLGSGAARNRALEHARGNWIAPMDADDLSVPERLNMTVDLMAADPELVAVSGQIAAFGDWGGPVVLVRYPTSGYEIGRAFARRRMGLAHPASLYRKRAALALGGYDPACRRAQDFALFLKMSHLGMRAVPEVVLHYRTNNKVPLTYALTNARFGRFAAQRNSPGERTRENPTTLGGGPSALGADAVAVASWIRQRTMTHYRLRALDHEARQQHRVG
jgi:glycosyltransferase involved in cell wall biosynthesis